MQPDGFVASCVVGYPEEEIERIGELAGDPAIGSPPMLKRGSWDSGWQTPLPMDTPTRTGAGF